METTGWAVENQYLVFELAREIDGKQYSKVVKTALTITPGDIETVLEGAVSD